MKFSRSTSLILMVAFVKLLGLIEASRQRAPRDNKKAGIGERKSSAEMRNSGAGGGVVVEGTTLIGLRSEVSSSQTETLLPRYSNIYNSTNRALIIDSLTQLGQRTQIDASCVFLKVIENNNLTAFHALLDQKLDPFKSSDSGLNAYDHLIILGSTRTTAQNAMYDTLDTLYQQSKSTSGQDYRLFEDLRSMHLARTSNKFDRTENRLKRYQDGSTNIHQAIKYGNLPYFDHLNTVISGPELTTPWGPPTVPEDSPPIVSERIRGNVPIGWTPLMLAVTLNRIEIVKKMGNLDLDQGHDGLTVFHLIMRLPLTDRVEMLKLFARKSEEYSAYADLKEMFVDKKTFEIKSLSHFLAVAFELQEQAPAPTQEEICQNILNLMVNLDTILAAVKYLKVDEIDIYLDVTLPFSRTLIEGNTMKIWGALKESFLVDSPKFTDEKDIDKLHKVLSKYQFSLSKSETVDGKEVTPYIDFFTSPDKLHPIFILTILKFIRDINHPSDIGFYESVLLIAIKKGDIAMIETILENHAVLKLDLDHERLQRIPSEASYKEGVIHYMIRHIKDEIELCTMIDLLLLIHPEALSQRSIMSLGNSHSYTVKESDIEIGSVHAIIAKRNGWTPLMYAVAFHKDTLAKNLIKKGADLYATGVDGICVKEICDERLSAFDRFYARLTTGSSSELNQVEVNKLKMRYIKKRVKENVHKIKVELEKELKITW